MTTRSKLILFVTIGFCAVLLAMRLPALAVHWLGLLVLSGGWMIAIGALYQVKLYALEKDVLYYLMILFAGVIWLCMITITLFWLILFLK